MQGRPTSWDLADLQ